MSTNAIFTTVLLPGASRDNFQLFPTLKQRDGSLSSVALCLCFVDTFLHVFKPCDI